MISRPPHVHLDVLYYKTTMSAPETLLRHLCSLGRDGAVADEPVPSEGRVLWARGDVVYSLHLFFVWLRGTWPAPTLADFAALEAAENRGSTTFAQRFAALKRAQAIVFLTDNQAYRFKRNRQFLLRLRADLISAGRDPDTVPVVFQINCYCREDVLKTPTSDIIQVLTWPRCDHVEVFPQEMRGAKEALDRAITLYEEMSAEHEAR
ncbi:hypothetical protein WME98_05430 [Sorangium sp. So ce296]|uniref:hypothetical protein n=1 Tax=Sorangium sp. So ce296 TaxID=3133296 RepID=UPI003F621F47